MGLLSLLKIAQSSILNATIKGNNSKFVMMLLLIGGIQNLYYFQLKNLLLYMNLKILVVKLLIFHNPKNVLLIILIMTGTFYLLKVSNLLVLLKPKKSKNNDQKPQNCILNKYNLRFNERYI